MKYIQRTNGKRVIVEKKKKSKRYYGQGLIKWSFCIGILLLTVLLCRFLDQRIQDGKIVDKIVSTITKPAEEKGEAVFLEDTETEMPTEKEILVCLDPGHGGMDPGGDYQGRIESTDNWELALAIQAEMESLGIQVVMTRQDNDTKVFLKERVATANASGADYFISIHRNTGDGYGYETWMTGNANSLTEALTTNIHNAMIDVGVQRDRGIKVGTESGEGSDYYVIHNTTMPACLLEVGFINVEEDNRLFDENRQAYAKAIAEAVLKTHEQKDSLSDNLTTENTTEEENGADTLLSEGMTLDNSAIDNISTLDSEILEWGQGINVDEWNRPTGSLSYQEKFKDYSADFIIPTTQKVIYLTFDEGYEYGCTPSILQTLKEKDVKAVFFVTQPYAEDNPELVRQMIDEGHIVGNHSVTHPSKGIPSLNVDGQKQEIMGNHQYIKDNFGYDMFLFRYPAGKFSQQSLAVVNNCGYRSVFWSFAYLDYDVNNQPNEAESLQKIMDRLHPGAIYLLHAESWTNTNILGDFIDQAREAGYTFGIYTDTLN